MYLIRHRSRRRGVSRYAWPFIILAWIAAMAFLITVRPSLDDPPAEAHASPPTPDLPYDIVATGTLLDLPDPGANGSDPTDSRDVGAALRSDPDHETDGGSPPVRPKPEVSAAVAEPNQLDPGGGPDGDRPGPAAPVPGTD